MTTALLLVLQIIFLDICLSGDNAIVIGAAASGLQPRLRTRAIFIGMGLALGLRVAATALAANLMQVKLLGFAGGLALLWVAWKMLPLGTDDSDEQVGGRRAVTFWAALATIVVADISMSLDNVMAVAAVAQGNYLALGLGLLLSMAILTGGAKLVASLIERHRWLTYTGVALVALVAGEMIFRNFGAVTAAYAYVFQH